MKKTMTFVIMTVFVIAIAVPAYAAARNGAIARGTNTTAAAFVDANSDGVCDNYASRPQDGTGRRMMGSANSGTCAAGGGFVDANKDGVCDNMGTRSQSGASRGMMNRGGNGARVNTPVSK